MEQTTIDWYRTYFNNRTYDYFKDKKIREISSSDVNKFFIMLRNTKSIFTKKLLSPKTIKHYRTILHTIFERAYEQEVVEKNVIDSVTIPNVKKSITGKFYSPDEVSECITKLTTYNDKSLLLIFSLSVICGLRPGELRGLLWSKINFDTKEILIDKSLATTKKGNIYKTTKTNDIRNLSVTDFVITLLKLHKENEILKRKKLNIKNNIENCYVFINDKYEPITSQSINVKWKKFCCACNIRYISQYGFRHTTATMLAFNNVPLPNISKHMGHTNLNTTQIYIHAVDEMNEKIKEVFELNTTPKIYQVK